MGKNKKFNKNNKFIWVVGFIGIIIFLLLFILIQNPKTTNLKQQDKSINPTSQLLSKSYHSDLLDITFDIPNDIIFKEENALREIILEKNGGIIKLHAYGTNRSYKNIKEFLDELYSSADVPKQVTRKHIQIGGKECEISILKKYKKYYCYLDSNSFLSFYTESSELYSDLDRIARSFRYEP